MSRSVTGTNRGQEMALLIWPSLILVAGYGYMVTFSPGQTGWYPGYALALLLGGFWGVHLVLRVTRHGGDEYFLPIAATLTSLGLIFLFRLDPGLAYRQIIWTVMGLLVLIVITAGFRDYQRLEQYPYFFLSLGLFFLIITVLLGTRIGGAKSWLTLGSFRMQPVEAVKVLMVMYLAGYLSDRRELLLQGAGRLSWGPLLAAVALAVFLLVLQRDLGSAMILLITFLAMLYLATGKLRFCMAGGALFSLGAVIAYMIFPYLRTRIAVWINPWADYNGAGYQVVQALITLGSGGIIGTGLGLGYSQVIPAVATDFIFATMGEEMGLMGSLGIILLYLLFALRGFCAALRAPEEQGVLLAGGLTVLCTFQALIIMAGVCKLLPLTGVTLPFVSYGGSSLIISYLLLALLLNVSAAGREAGL
ncbi:FtsW/RodA/SpoVE family cell cycle protein [Moorella sulfitireducens]|uniref:FtsW/RodA/SpoVE family cell cycle protein n=1 Tax=Neomoorella sulfitireducens TaxID=2972948 RepID=UPI0021AD110B|nr:FtsW/RodA/SpoVE family cell cycle protein [Moorella sulfitireducens]